MKLIVRPEAEGDLADAYAWYNQQRPGLGDEFFAAIDEAATFILERPLSFPEVHKAIRRVLLRRFPYAMYFTIVDDDVQVLAVFHGRRSPSALKDRTGHTHSE